MHVVKYTNVVIVEEYNFPEYSTLTFLTLDIRNPKHRSGAYITMKEELLYYMIHLLQNYNFFHRRKGNVMIISTSTVQNSRFMITRKS